MDILGFVNLYVVPGLVLGAICAVGAIGVSLLFGILRFAHFAHGDLATLGGFLALPAVWVLGLQAIRATWAIGAALAAAAGVFAGMDVHLHSSTGWDVMLPVFGAAILGGIGRPQGAIAGDLLMGLIEELATAPLFFGASLLPQAYKSGVAFAVLVGVLLVRPTGIFRGKLF